MASTNEQVLQVIRGYVKAYATVSGALTDQQVIPADDKGVRPIKPYATVKILTSDLWIGVDEELSYDDSGTPKVIQRGQREGTVSIQTFGNDTDEWLERLALQLMLPAPRATLETGEIYLEPISAILNLSTLLDTGFEQRYGRDFMFSYQIQTPTAEAVTQVPLEDVEIKLTAGDKESGASDEYKETVNITI